MLWICSYASLCDLQVWMPIQILGIKITAECIYHYLLYAQIISIKKYSSHFFSYF